MIGFTRSLHFIGSFHCLRCQWLKTCISLKKYLHYPYVGTKRGCFCWTFCPKNLWAETQVGRLAGKFKDPSNRLLSIGGTFADKMPCQWETAGMADPNWVVNVHCFRDGTPRMKFWGMGDAWAGWGGAQTCPSLWRGRSPLEASLNNWVGGRLAQRLELWAGWKRLLDPSPFGCPGWN